MRTRGGKRTMTWRALEGGPPLTRRGTPAVLHVLPVRLPLVPLVPLSLLQSRALGETVDWRRQSDQPTSQVLGLDVGRLWRRAYVVSAGCSRYDENVTKETKSCS